MASIAGTLGSDKEKGTPVLLFNPVAAERSDCVTIPGEYDAFDGEGHRYASQCTEVDWREYGAADRDAPMLKAYFAPNIRNTTAEYEIPYGVVSHGVGDYEYSSCAL